MATRRDSSDDLIRFLREASSERDNPLLVDDWGPLVEEVERAAERHQSDASQPLLTIGRYEALGACGAGGHGVVLRARDPKLDRLVALKLCRLGTPNAAQALVREAKTLAKLSHPNIVTIYDLGDEGDRVFFVMELIEGGSTLEALIARRPGWEVIVDVLRAAGRGLAAAHREKITHGDFKPANVLFDADGHPRVADFGLARVVLEHEPEATREQLRRRTGTLPFMAPEVLRGHACNPLADQWSFCVVLLLALNHGEWPFPGYRSEAVLRAIESGPLPEIKPVVPAALRRIVRRGLSVDPSERFANMDELLDALDRVRAPASSRSRAAAWIGFGVSLGVTFAGVLGWVGRERIEDSRTKEPVQLPSPSPSPCARGWSNVDLDPVVVAVCELIRRDEFVEADRVWDREHEVRLNPEHRKHAALGEHSLIVARTFVRRASSIEHTDADGAEAAARRAVGWAIEAAALLRQGGDDIRVKIVIWRARTLTN